MLVGKAAIEQDFECFGRGFAGLLAAEAPELVHVLPRVGTGDEAGDCCASAQTTLIQILKFP